MTQSAKKADGAKTERETRPSSLISRSPGKRGSRKPRQANRLISPRSGSLRADKSSAADASGPGDAPKDTDDAEEAGAIDRGADRKNREAVGEPPFMLALAVREALKEAVAAFSSTPGVVDLPSPLTHEVLFHAVKHARSVP